MKIFKSSKYLLSRDMLFSITAMVASLAVLVDPCDQPPPDGATSNQSKEFVKTPCFDTIEQETKMNL